MKFNDTYINKEKRYSLGVETTTGKYYLSIPVGNTLVDYEEYYEINIDEFKRYQQGDNVDPFLKRCRHRENDDRLMMKPGKDRGVAL